MYGNELRMVVLCCVGYTAQVVETCHACSPVRGMLETAAAEYTDCERNQSCISPIHCGIITNLKNANYVSLKAAICQMPY